MQSLPDLVGRLLRRGLRRPSAADPAPIERAREQPPLFSEILSAATYLDFGGVPLEYWPGYRHTDHDQEREEDR
jgi:hypothetical protein